MKDLQNTLRFITRHPLNNRNKLGALWRFLKWQAMSRLSKKSIIVPFFNKSKLSVVKGMTGATGNIYCGLHEFESMGFLIHFLRADDVFIDVGANIGSYSIMSASLGAKCYSFEPIAEGYERLCENIKINSYESFIRPFKIAISDKCGSVRMTSNLDTTNRICSDDIDDVQGTVVVKAQDLDSVLLDIYPSAIKIDVEGAESQVIKGGPCFFKKETLLAAIVEVNHKATHELMLEIGFRPYSYDPFNRGLVQLGGVNTESANTLYLRNIEVIRKRVESAPKFEILGQNI